MLQLAVPNPKRHNNYCKSHLLLMMIVRQLRTSSLFPDHHSDGCACVWLGLAKNDMQLFYRAVFLWVSFRVARLNENHEPEDSSGWPVWECSHWVLIQNCRVKATAGKCVSFSHYVIDYFLIRRASKWTQSIIHCHVQVICCSQRHRKGGF